MKFNKNAVNREIPSELLGKELIPFTGKGKGPFKNRKYAPKVRHLSPGDSKIVKTLREAILKGELTDEPFYEPEMSSYCDLHDQYSLGRAFHGPIRRDILSRSGGHNACNCNRRRRGRW